MFNFLLLMSVFLANAPANPEPKEPVREIVVEAHKNIEIYVAPPIITNNAPSVESHINPKAFFKHTSSHWKNAKIKNERGTYEPIGMHVERVYVYDADTIEYAWDNCNYKRDPLKCGTKNDHYVLQPYIDIDENQTVIMIVLYDSYAQVVGSSTHTDDKIIKWIKQQEITIKQEQQQPGLLGGGGQAVTIHKPKEELPLKWEIPQRLLDNHIRQASLKLWVGIRL